MKTKTFTWIKGRLLIAAFLFISTNLLAQYPAGSPVAINGKLSVIGTQLSNECGNPVQLRGMSSHGLQWYGNCVNTGSLDYLVNNWKIDIFRLAMYVQEGGYVNNPSYWKGWIDNMVDECGKRGIYCMIDWHVLNPGDPYANINESRDFWSYMSNKHKGKKHVLYEICNEPNGVDWNRVKSYADDIIPRIRANDPSTIVIVGTPTWSQDVDIAANNKLNYSNIMYTLHFYSGSHGDALRNKANTALSRGIALFVTEFGTSSASGDGGPYLAEGDRWMSWMAANKISWAQWSYADKGEASAALIGGSCNSGNWNNTTQSGAWVRDKLINPADNFVCNGTNPPPPPPPTTQSPYGGTAAPIPGKIEAERYDEGGTLAYSDATAGNEGAAFRSQDVDIEATTDAGGGYNVGWTAAGEWLEYTVNVSAAGKYDFKPIVAATATGKSFHIEMNGTNVTGAIAVPNTGGWQTWQTVTVPGITLSAGTQIMRIYFDTDGINLNYVEVSAAAVPNQAPSVSLTSPANNASFTAPASISISANASDSDGSISKVEFFNGSTKLGEDLSAPYSYTWNNVAAGTYTITARATDNNGAVTTSSARTIIVNAPANQAPTVSITSPSNNASFTAPANINISANASDADGSVSNVQFYNGSALLGSDASAPYSFTWSNVAAGTYTLTARATDNSGAVTTSSAITVVVNAASNQAPTVSITSPTNNASFTAPASISISANASDADGSVSNVQFYNGSALLGSDASAPYSFTWSNVAAGTYTLTARATDNSGAVTISSTVTVVVTGVTNPNPGNCDLNAVPAASLWSVRNDWSDQHSGSGVSNENSALKVKHRQWGNSKLWVIETGKTLTIENGKTYTVEFEFQNDAGMPVNSIDVGLASSVQWNAPVLAQAAVNVSAGNGVKSATFTSSGNATVSLAIRLNWPAQISKEANVYIKNISVCESGQAIQLASLNSDAYVTGSNPFENQTTVRIDYERTVQMQLVLTDLSGAVRWESWSHTTNQEVYLGSGLPAGTYIVKAVFEGRVVTFRIVKN